MNKPINDINEQDQQQTKINSEHLDQLNVVQQIPEDYNIVNQHIFKKEQKKYSVPVQKDKYIKKLMDENNLKRSKEQSVKRYEEQQKKKEQPWPEKDPYPPGTKQPQNTDSKPLKSLIDNKSPSGQQKPSVYNQKNQIIVQGLSELNNVGQIPQPQDYSIVHQYIFKKNQTNNSKVDKQLYVKKLDQKKNNKNGEQSNMKPKQEVKNQQKIVQKKEQNNKDIANTNNKIEVDHNIDFTQKKYDDLNLDRDSKQIPFKQHQIGQPREIKTYDFDKIKSFQNQNKQQKQPVKQNQPDKKPTQNKTFDSKTAKQQKPDNNPGQQIFPFSHQQKLTDQMKKYIEQAKRKQKEQQQRQKNKKDSVSDKKNHDSSSTIKIDADNLQDRKPEVNKTPNPENNKDINMNNYDPLDNAQRNSVPNISNMLKQDTTTSDPQQKKVFLIKVLVLLLIIFTFLYNCCSKKEQKGTYEPVEFTQVDDAIIPKQNHNSSHSFSNQSAQRL